MVWLFKISLKGLGVFTILACLQFGTIGMKVTRSIEMVMSSTLTSVPVELRPREYRNLRPLPCSGQYKVSSKETKFSFFLGPSRMTTQDKGEGKCIARGIMPIAIPEDMESVLLGTALSSNQVDNYKTSSGLTITDRDGGLFDSLLTALPLIPNSNYKRDIYDALKLKGSCISPYHGFIDALQKHTSLTLRGLLIEEADKQGEFSVTLGAAVLLAKNDVSYKWKLTASQYKCIKDVAKSDEAALVNCYMDELVGLALACDLPIVVPSTLYDSMCVDGLIELQSVQGAYGESPQTPRILITAPYFNTPQEAQIWRLEQERQQREAERSAKRAAKTVPKAWELKDAGSFFVLKVSEKRAILRASGLFDLPRPREGKLIYARIVLLDW